MGNRISNHIKIEETEFQNQKHRYRLEKQGVGGGLSVICLSAFHTGAAV